MHFSNFAFVQEDIRGSFWIISSSRMAESSHPQQMKKKDGSDSQPCALTVSRVDFIISTYPDLQPFLEMAVVLLEGVYEHVKSAATPTDTGKSKCK